MFAKGTISYEKRRLIHNGLCTHIYPDWIVVPESTEDVAAIVKITNRLETVQDLESNNLQYNTLARWLTGTNDSSTKRLMFQVLFLFHNFLQNSLQKLFQFIFIIFL